MKLRERKGFSLLEVMFAVAICGMMCAGALSLMIKIDTSNRWMYERTIAYRAAHQAMEVLLAEDIDSMLLQDGNTFAVTQTTSDVATGTITITDLNWGAAGDTADKAYLVRMEVREYSVILTAVRTRT